MPDREPDVAPVATGATGRYQRRQGEYQRRVERIERAIALEVRELPSLVDKNIFYDKLSRSIWRQWSDFTKGLSQPVKEVEKPDPPETPAWVQRSLDELHQITETLAGGDEAVLEAHAVDAAINLLVASRKSGVKIEPGVARVLATTAAVVINRRLSQA